MPSIVHPSPSDISAFPPVLQTSGGVGAVSATPLPPPRYLPRYFDGHPLLSDGRPESIERSWGGLRRRASILARKGGVPDSRTEGARKPISSASDPSTWHGLLWTGSALAESPAPARYRRRLFRCLAATQT